MSLLNDFKLGADPEFAVMNGDRATVIRATDPLAPWGIDHGGYVVEPHPKPVLSVRDLVANLRVSMNDFATVAPTGRWRAGAYLVTDTRPLTFGGHIHIDKPRPGEEIAALDLFREHLEKLDILPATECANRRAGGNYGGKGDVRVEHGHFEYRAFPSFLFSQRVTKLCFLAAKLATIDPPAVREEMGRVETASLPKLKAFYERFKGKDDDVDWLINGGMFTRKLAIDPNRDLKEVWKVEPQKENPRWKEAQRRVNWEVPTQALNPLRMNEPPFSGYAYLHAPSNLVITSSILFGMTHWAKVSARISGRPDLPPVIPGNNYYVDNQEFRFKCIGRLGQPDTEDLFTKRVLWHGTGGYVRYLVPEVIDSGNDSVFKRFNSLTRSLLQGAAPQRTARIGTIDIWNGLPHIVTEVHRN